MKYQFGLKAMLIWLTVAGIVLGVPLIQASIFGRYGGGASPHLLSVYVAMIATSMWLPAAFFAYAAGRREMTVWMLVALTVAEALSLGFLAMFWKTAYAFVFDRAID